MYEDRPGCNLAAARAVTSEKMFVYSQFDAGNGKTCTNLLMYWYFKKYTKLLPIYIVKNEVLMHQASDVAKSMQMEKDV